ncbi:hypothetical protein DFP72DRAFT_479438 [Ephemerocybe angulata]|uniref:Uncharacterized protein n=1 Tax=Ephemerocybe angulata TaxID=980116 RepID=A0A8H6IFP9_9AGAR|nr:hypothetical protein DFP72DRAFT_479438 [Tulosesus angulatus]
MYRPRRLAVQPYLSHRVVPLHRLVHLSSVFCLLSYGSADPRSTTIGRISQHASVDDIAPLFWRAGVHTEQATPQRKAM